MVENIFKTDENGLIAGQPPKVTCYEEAVQVREQMTDTMYEQVKNELKTLLKSRKSIFQMRTEAFNRIGIKGDGVTPMKNRTPGKLGTAVEDQMMSIGRDCQKREDELEEEIHSRVHLFPIWWAFLSHIPGMGVIIAGWLITSINIHHATTVSKIYSVAGVNPGKVMGKKDMSLAKAQKSEYPIVRTYQDMQGKQRAHVQTNIPIRGDTMTAGFLRPFNADLHDAVCGLLADGFVRVGLNKNTYVRDYYYPVKHRLENSNKLVFDRVKKKQVPWKDTTPLHRDQSAKRRMVKAFIADLYRYWRTEEGLYVRPPYGEEYLGHHHSDDDQENEDDDAIAA